MAKQNKNNNLNVLPIPREAIAAVGGEEDFVVIRFRLLEKRDKKR